MASMKYVKTELFNPNVMKSLLTHQGLSFDTRQTLKKYHKKRQNGNCIETIYDYSKDYQAAKVGRVYAHGAVGLQGFEREVRNALAQDLYFDVDMENAHCTILYKVCQDKGWVCDKLRDYVENREQVLQNIMEHYGASRKDAKNLMIRMMFLGYPESWVGETICENSTNTMEYALKFKEELHNIAKNVWGSYTELVDIVKKKRKINETQKLSSCLSLMLQTEEHKILMAIDECLKQNGRSMDVFIFDGGLVRKKDGETDLPENVLRTCEEYVKSSTGYDVKLVVKPMETTLVFDKEDDKEYSRMKKEFEKRHFKVMRPLLYVEELPNGEFYMRNVKEVKDAFCNMTAFACGDVVPFIKQWIEDPNIRTYETIDFLPPPLVCPQTTFNMWRGFAIDHLNVESSGNIQPVIDHINILVNHNDVGCRYVLNYLAQIVQCPGVLNGIALVFKSAQGSGKNVFLDFIQKILGKDLYYETANPTQDLWGRFSLGRKNRLLINIDETSGKDTYPHSEQLKNMITSPNYNYEQKGMNPITLINLNRIIFTTNNQTPVKIEEGDRRYCVFQCSDEKKGNKAYFDGLVAYFNDPMNQKAFYEYLKGLDISNVDWINDRPITELYQDIQESNTPIHVKFFKYLVENNSSDAMFKYSGFSFFEHFNEFLEKGKYSGCAMNNTAWGRLVKPLILNDDKDVSKGFITKTMSKGCVVYKFTCGDLRRWMVANKFLDGCMIDDDGL